MATVSIVDYLKGQGKDASMGARSKLASQYGIKGYSGTAQQNVSLLGSLQKASAKPKVTAPPKGKVTTPVKPNTSAAAANAAKAKAAAAAAAKAKAAAAAKQKAIDIKGAAPKSSSAAVANNPAILDSYGTTLKNLNMNPDQFRDVLLGTKNTSMNIDDFANQYGFDYSKEYAGKQAEAIRKAKEDGYNNNLREVEKNVMNSADALDKNYYLQGLQQQQAQTNNGLNAGIASDQDLRMAMSRQANLGEVYRDANVENMRINDSKGRLQGESLAYADELYNTRRNEGFQNTMQANQNNMAANQASSGNLMGFYGAMEGTRQFNNNFALQEGQLTGNYMAYDQRGGMQAFLQNQQNLDGNKLSGADRAKAQAQNAGYLNQLAATGVDVSRFQNGANYQQSIGTVGNFNQTMDQKGQNADIAFKEAEVTGKYTNPESKVYSDQLLQVEKQLERTDLTTSQRQALVKQREFAQRSLSGMGMRINYDKGKADYNSLLSEFTKKGSVQTQASKEFDKNYSLDQQKLAEEKRQADMADKLGWKDAAIKNQQVANDFVLGAEQNRLTGEELRIRESLGNAGIDVDKTANRIREAELKQQASAAKGKATSAKSTSGAVGMVVNMKSQAAAMKYLDENLDDMVKTGADVVKVFDAIEKRWPGTKKAVKGEKDTSNLKK